jgi:hypothetical protein
VQLDTFGRLVAGEPDALPGYTIDYVEIEDQRVVDSPGCPCTRSARDRAPLDKVTGVVLHVSAAELDAADAYEVSLYRRISVRSRAAARPGCTSADGALPRSALAARRRLARARRR